MTTTRTCKHRKFWFIGGGLWMWCYECGAIRQTHYVRGMNVITPASGWVRSTAERGGHNPSDEFERSKARYTKPKRST